MSAVTPDPNKVFALWGDSSVGARRLAAAIARLRTPNLDAAREDMSDPRHVEARALAQLEAMPPPSVDDSIVLLSGESTLAIELPRLARARGASLRDTLGEPLDSGAKSPKSDAAAFGPRHPWLGPFIGTLLILAGAIGISYVMHWQVDPFSSRPTFGSNPREGPTQIAPQPNQGTPVDPRADPGRSTGAGGVTRAPSAATPQTRVLVPIVLEPANATLRIDDWVVPTGSTSVQIAPGVRRFSVTLPGYRPLVQTVTVSAGMAPVSLVLQPDLGAPLVGTWAGTFDEKTFALTVIDQQGPFEGKLRIRARGTVDLGEGESQQFDMDGAFDLASRTLTLADAAKGYSFTAQVHSLGDGSSRISGSASRQGVDYVYEFWAAKH